MEKKVLIASDSTTDLNSELIERYGVKTVPLTVNLGEKSYVDGVDVDPDMIYRYYEENGRLPKTAAPNVVDFTDFFGKYTSEGYDIVLFTISSEMSSTYNNARLAAEEFEGVYVIDTRNLSTGGGLALVTAGDMAAKGCSAREIAEYCAALTNRIDASFVIDNLEFLYKGGRCSALAALGANLLKIKPCVAVRNGKMGVIRKYRGRYESVLEKYVLDQIGDVSEVEPDHIFVTHAGCDPTVNQRCVDIVKSLGYFKEVHLTRAGCTISSHCGRNTLGVLFIRKTALK
ncbi:MAG: DegV family protein [Clostridia bacterium]|nr:DegV family protein [Clostridia bacterium]